MTGLPGPLAQAYGRPPGGAESLQRPPQPPDILLPPAPGDPWSDPRADVRLGPPAVDEPEPEPVIPAPAERFTLRQALFERRLRLGTLVVLGIGALLIGALGAAAGVLLGSRTVVADPAVSLATAQPAVQRPAGSVAEIAARVLPAVVSIDVRLGQGGDTGSGVIIDASGYILTNNHVISLATDPEAELSVVFDDGAGTRSAARIIGRDPATDMAVIKVDDVSGLTVAALGDSDSLAVGDTVIAIGSPLGLSGTVTTGIVSALHRAVRLGGAGSDTNAVIDAVQTDAPINPGNSGGPLVDAGGAVIGINTAIRTLSSDPLGGGSIGLGFALPINDARRIAQTLIDHGEVIHAGMGLAVRSATDGATDGALVQDVAVDGPAAAAGISEGDVITAVGDRTVRNADEFAVAVDRHQVGQTVEVSLLRDGKSMTVRVTLTAA